MSLFDEFATDAAEIFNEAGRTVTFRNAEVKVMIPQTEVAMDLQTGGFVQSGSLVVRFLAASYAAQPIVDGEHVVYDGKLYRITSISRRPPGAIIECRCEPANAR